MRVAAAFAVALLAACPGKAKPGPAEPTPPPPAPLDWSAAGIDWSEPPAAAAERSWTVPTPTTLELANGMTVIVVENRRLPLVSAQLVVGHAGSAADPSGSEGLAALVADLLDEGTGSLTALEVAAELERLGAYLSTGAATETADLVLEGLRSTFADSLALMAASARAPSLTAADFERVKADRLSQLRRRRDRARSVVSLVFDRVLFGSHRYAHPSAGYPATVAAVDQQAVTDFYRARYRPENATLIVVGDIDAGELKPMVDAAFGDWSGGGEATPPAGALPTAELPRLVVVDKPGAAQTEVRIGRVFIDRRDARYFPALVSNTVLGGSFTSRLNNRLREQLGYTYGAGSSMWLGRDGGSWYARTALKTEVTVDGVREALTLIESMRTADVPADELARAKQLLVRRLPSRFETNSQIAGSLADLIGEGAPPTWFSGYSAGVEAVDAAAVRQLATDSWAGDKLVVIAVGDLATILDGLLGLGLGPALELDPEGQVVRTHPVR